MRHPGHSRGRSEARLGSSANSSPGWSRQTLPWAPSGGLQGGGEKPCDQAGGPQVAAAKLAGLDPGDLGEGSFLLGAGGGDGAGARGGGLRVLP